MAIDPSDTKLDSRRDLYRRSEELARLSRDSASQVGDGRSRDVGQSSVVRTDPLADRGATRDRSTAQDEARDQERRIDDLIRMASTGASLDGSRRLTPSQLDAVDAELRALQTRDAAEARRAVLQTTVPSLEAAYHRAKNRFDQAQTGSSGAEKEDARRALENAARERDIGRADFKAQADQFRLAGAQGRLQGAQAELDALKAKGPGQLSSDEAKRYVLLLGTGREGLAALKNAARQAKEAANRSAAESLSYHPTVLDTVGPSRAVYKAGDPGTVGRSPDDLANERDPDVSGAGRRQSVGSGKGLFELAREEYGQAPAAYAVAYANRIDNPTQVAGGREVTLPPDAWVQTFMRRLQNGEIQIDRQGRVSGDLPERPAELSRDVRAQHFGTVAM